MRSTGGWPCPPALTMPISTSKGLELNIGFGLKQICTGKDICSLLKICVHHVAIIWKKLFKPKDARERLWATDWYKTSSQLRSLRGFTTVVLLFIREIGVFTATACGFFGKKITHQDSVFLHVSLCLTAILASFGQAPSSSTKNYRLKLSSDTPVRFLQPAWFTS